MLSSSPSGGGKRHCLVFFGVQGQQGSPAMMPWATEAMGCLAHRAGTVALVSSILDKRRPGQPPRVRLDYLRAARTEGLLTDDEMPAVQRLREMRNLAAHSVDPGITITDALRYYDIADATPAADQRHRHPGQDVRQRARRENSGSHATFVGRCRRPRSARRS
jgi:hypothetical protein